MSTTTRVLADSIQNILDYLVGADLALYANPLSITPTRVTFIRHHPEAAFLVDRSHPGLDQYLSWISTGSYSAVLADAGLLQMSFKVEGGKVTEHRLAYTPCPFILDEEMLKSGEPIADIVETYRGSDAPMRTPIRFDYAPAVSKRGHPASHVTLNGANCRIACVAPMHPMRFVDFVYRSFYPDQWVAHEPFFRPAVGRHLGPGVITEDDQQSVHVSWNIHASVACRK